MVNKMKARKKLPPFTSMVLIGEMYKRQVYLEEEMLENKFTSFLYHYTSEK